MSKSNEKKESPYFIKAFWALVFLIPICWIFPKAIPFSLWEVWEFKEGPIQWIKTFSPFLVWLIFLSLFTLLFSRDKIKWIEVKTIKIKDIFSSGFIISVWTGIMEEISFRWLLFFWAIIAVKISNFIFLGFIDINIIKWIHLHIVGYIADVTTFYYLHDLLYHPVSWAVGAGLLTANAAFRDGHKYQGYIGWIDSWFFGMAMFYILFKYGLLACIFLHFATNMMLFIFNALYMSAEKTIRNAW